MIPLYNITSADAYKVGDYCVVRLDARIRKIVRITFDPLMRAMLLGLMLPNGNIVNYYANNVERFVSAETMNATNPEFTKAFEERRA